MSVASRSGALVDLKRNEVLEEAHYEKWNHWPVNWSTVWVGALTAVTVALIFGLIGIVIGAQILAPEHRIVDLKKLAFGSLAYSVFAAFPDLRRSRLGRGQSCRHPTLGTRHSAWGHRLAGGGSSAGSSRCAGCGIFTGAWHAGLVGTNMHDNNGPFERPAPLSTDATEAERAQYRADVDRYASEVKQWRQ